jgi:putative sterol carrier protein
MKSDKIILMKVTSRERPEQLIRCIEEYHRLANNPKQMVWLFSFDIDDEKMQARKEEITSLMFKLRLVANLVWANSVSKIDAINRDFLTYKDNNWHILLNISDDQLPIVQGYDDIIREAMPDNLDASLWFSDGHQNDIITQEILGKWYAVKQGYIYYPAYKSFFCDNESTEVAQIKGKLLKFDQCIVKHLHPVWGINDHIKEDELYKRNNAHWEHDMSLYKHRKAHNFQL